MPPERATKQRSHPLSQHPGAWSRALPTDVLARLLAKANCDFEGRPSENQISVVQVKMSMCDHLGPELSHTHFFFELVAF